MSSVPLIFYYYRYRQQTYLPLAGTSLFSNSYVASLIQTATETLGKLKSLLTESGKGGIIFATASLLRLWAVKNGKCCRDCYWRLDHKWLLMQMVWLKSDTVKSLWNLSATVICPIIYLDIVSGDISKKHEDEERIGEVLIQNRKVPAM